MRKLITYTLFVLASMQAMPLWAGSGKAVVPHWQANGATQNTAIFISNITNHTLVVTVKFYDQLGNALPPSSFFNFQNGNTELAPRNSGNASLSMTTATAGYAVVQWSNKPGDDDPFGLVAHAHRAENATGLVYRYSIPVNGGQPF